MARQVTNGFNAVMLDWAHDLVLRGVARDPLGDHSSPALEDLVAVGFVERAEGAARLTDSGRRALELGVPSRRERWAYRVTIGCAAIYVLASVSERVF